MDSKPVINRRTFLAASGASALSLGSRRPKAPLPNILFVFSDEHRYQSLSFTEMPQVHTPALARMAREGFQFRQCVSNYPVCSPYRAMLMTGRWPYQTGVVDNDLPLQEAEYTLGHAFKAAGYRTGYIGKWHLGGERAEPFGFDTSLIWTGTNDHYDTARYHPLDGAPVSPSGYNATLMTDQALEFIRDAGCAPYFLMLSLNPPHSRFTDAPPDMRALYPDASLPRRPNVPASLLEGSGITRQNGSPHFEGYHAHVTAVDAELGRLLDTVRASGTERETIVLYTSDHGSQLGSQGIGGKRQPFEESLRVPFLAWCPGKISAGACSDALIGATDLMPTLCGLAGLPQAPSCSGTDFSGHLLDGSGPEPEAQLIMHISKEHASGGKSHPAPLFRGIRTSRHTYVVNEHGPLYLFDRDKDPYQMHDLSQDPHLESLRGKLALELQQLLREAGDSFRVI